MEQYDLDRLSFYQARIPAKQAVMRQARVAQINPLTPRSARFDLSINWRFRIPDETPITFTDLNCGTQTFTPNKDLGDFLVWRKEGMPAYELAVVVDDHLMNITEVVRGQDLLTSTARQLLLYKTLDWTPPDFYHCPLIKDEQGNRLAKRSDSLALRTLFEQGLSAENIHKQFEA